MTPAVPASPERIMGPHGILSLLSFVFKCTFQCFSQYADVQICQLYVFFIQQVYLYLKPTPSFGVERAISISVTGAFCRDVIMYMFIAVYEVMPAVAFMFCTIFSIHHPPPTVRRTILTVFVCFHLPSLFQALLPSPFQIC